MQRKGVEIMSGGEEAQEQLSEADREQCDLTDCTQVTNANEKLRFFMDSETQHCHIRRVKNNCWQKLDLGFRTQPSRRATVSFIND